MVREYEQIKFASDATTDDMMDQIMTMMKGMKHQTFNARPLPKDPVILTFESSSGLINNTELWKDTCPVCRPIVRDMKTFCIPDQEATFQDQNVFIKWDVVFSKLLSAFMMPASLEPSSVPEDDNDDESKALVTSQTPSQPDKRDKEQSSLVKTEDDEIGPAKQTAHHDEPEEMEFCQFCAYFACLMFDDPSYSFCISGGGNDDFELDCCCMDSMMESNRVKRVTRKLLTYAEKFGDDAHITFLIQPIDHNLDDQAFGKIRFQAYSHSPSMSKKDLLDILGLRRELVLEVYGIPGQLSGDVPVLQYWPISTEPESWPGFGKHWIAECISGHKDCRPPVKGPLPTRIVEVIDDDNVRVVSGADSGTDFYITLSYRWGGPQHFSLTIDTLTDKHKGFGVSSLPAALKDAVTVTKALGIKFIWIDSLCIIQDSPDDKQKELPRMADYYRNSYLTITASTGKAANSFLISKRLCTTHPKPGIPKDLVPLGLLMSPIFEVTEQKDGESDIVGTQFTRDVIDCVLVRTEVPYFLSMEPISTRGWTFQERVLSPRNLIFGGRLVWQCHTRQASAGGFPYWNDDAPSVDLRALGRTLFNSHHKIGQEVTHIGGPSVDKAQYDLWYRAVEEYSRRDLSVASDKLPAISALAQVFRELTGDEYLAGIWGGDLLRGLMWSTYPTLDLSKPHLWRAPSWSWAYHDNEVSYKGIPPPYALPVARVLSSAAIPLSSMTPLGEVSSAFLEIEGPVLELEKSVTTFLMQKENELPPIQDTAEARYKQMNQFQSKNSRTGVGCCDWQPPDGHILLVLLATPFTVHSSESQQLDVAPRTSSGSSSDHAVEHQPQPENENDVQGDPAGTDDGHSVDRAVGVVNGYTLSGLVLGPAGNGRGAENQKYERLARFTSLGPGCRINKPADLEKLNRRVVII
ncbi:hypothetical protein GJ744_010246 [Endocarpon pusillum]|uniref:Heterokaryon incompatibility domain-containing protein n=1 Tax=Endocarpon pusillum TaxID=364733 RepID=A0A8H7AEM0_9EURO|nr:hypothetical protein GJ744_010246 [Endocarpon pusillum]